MTTTLLISLKISITPDNKQLSGIATDEEYVPKHAVAFYNADMHSFSNPLSDERSASVCFFR
jgi:hypothetical protein